MTETTPPLNPAERSRITDAVDELTVQIARRLCADNPHAGEREVRLAVLTAARLLSAELDTHLDRAARGAARAGADYVEIGAAVGMSRQGARRRWPGLADLSRDARQP
ncbi:hypothetical protein Q0Z83_039070 [Actinoplanes sichuanensis]|uniref:Uncharacterized protein n=1 Tax=Actinoplanes sichuanensis TaxID=512349 RepID=A0ABW4AUL2_9ACTN|nr:hypothetical protein [Actinoplanes sichuanensis]BEL05716.1 hypothetical protein Q0Z83_039070 [Actinoplanes sichuanensis]